MFFRPSELIINPNGSAYHLGLLPEDVTNSIITVGDPDRTDLVAKYFDKITKVVSIREFKTIIGEYRGKRLMVISTGIGTDNIDIVINELDALVNIDFITREEKVNKKRLNIYRLGTSGAIHESIPLDSFLVSTHGIGLDSLAHFYDRSGLIEEDQERFLYDLLKDDLPKVHPYICSGDEANIAKFDDAIFLKGITTTLPGFYGPQCRNLRAKPLSTKFLDIISRYEYEGRTVTNLEMETAGIYLLASILGHRAVSISTLVANRITGEFSKNPQKAVEHMIETCLSLID
jgi:uridine phosphorylase